MRAHGPAGPLGLVGHGAVPAAQAQPGGELGHDEVELGLGPLGPGEIGAGAGVLDLVLQGEDPGAVLGLRSFVEDRLPAAAGDRPPSSCASSRTWNSVPGAETRRWRSARPLVWRAATERPP